MGGTRFRVIYNLFSWIEMKLFGPLVGRYVPFNILLNSGIAFTLYQMARKFSRSVYVGFLFGIDAGPEHLNGQNFREAPLAVTVMIAAADLMVFILVALFVIRMVRSRKNCGGYLKTSALFICFIGACIVCSSVTIRLEMRWVYVSYAAALLFLAWIFGVLMEERGGRRTAGGRRFRT